MLENVFLGLFNTLLGLLKPILFFIVNLGLLCLAPFITAVFIYHIYYKIKGYKRIKDERGFYKEHSLLYKLFLELPRQIVNDYFSLDPNIFTEYGLYIVAGQQGCGKSMFMAYILNRWKTIYPRLKIISNMGYVKEDTKLVDISQLSLNTNGIYGEVDVIDELQSVLGTEYSLKFPDNLKQLICQQRKVRRCILSATQNLDQIAKPLRQQTRYIFVPKTYFGCLTIVKQYKAKFDKDSQFIINEQINRHIKTYVFVHDDKLRHSYDSYKTVEKINVK